MKRPGHPHCLPGFFRSASAARLFVFLLMPAMAGLFGLSPAAWAADPPAPVKPKTAAELEKEAGLRIANFEHPEDVQVGLFADESQTRNPSAICFDEKGRLYIAEIDRWRAGVDDIRQRPTMLLEDLATTTNADRLKMFENHVAEFPMSYYTDFSDRIRVVNDSDGDGRADESWIFAEDFDDALDGPGIGLLSGGNGVIYYTDIPHLWKLQDTDGDGKADERTSLQDGFGVRMSISGHDLHGLVWGPDGKIYWSVGDRGYHFTTKEGRTYNEPIRGAVFRCDPDGSNVEEFYRGLRNPQELAFDQFGNLFTCDNDADQWDTGRLVYILEGGDSGWVQGHQTLLNFRDQLGLRTPDYEHPGHKTLPMNPWMTEGLWEPRFEGQPAWILPPLSKTSWGPSGLVFNYGATALPDRYANHFFVCNFGGSNGDLETFAVEPAGAGYQTVDNHIFMKGSGNTDVEFGPDGRMYLSCFNNNGWYKQDIGNIYTLYTPDKLDDPLLAETQKLLGEDLTQRSPGELATLLGHADLRVRQRAQFAMVSQDAAEDLATAAQAGEPLLKRLHAIWGLGQLARQTPALLTEKLIPLLQDEDAEVRAQAAKTLSDSRTYEAGEALVAALDDTSPRVQTFAAIGVGKCGNAFAFDKLLELLATNNDQDAFLRHGCVMGLYYLNEREKMLKKVDDESPAVRRGILLTLRRLLDPRAKYFLEDPDPSLVAEAIRAINDLNLPTAQSALAAKLDLWTTPDGQAPLPETPMDAILHTRMINANFRLGQPEQAARLLNYAANAQLPEMLRKDALAALEEWDAPNPVDATTGIYRPLDPAKRGDITEAVKTGLPDVLGHAEGALLASGTRLARKYGYEIPTDILTRQLTAATPVTTEVRVEALRSLAKRNDPALAGLIGDLMKDADPAVHAEAVRYLLDAEPDRGRAEALAMAESKNTKDRQNGYALLAGVEHPDVTAFFADAFQNFVEGYEPEETQLDLLQAVEQRTQDAELQANLAAYQGSLDASDPLAPYRVCLKGGDPKVGATIFSTHAVGQCTKCHMIFGDGGTAGPDLSAIGKQRDANHILEALVNPSGFIVPGYGITLVTLKDGTALGGTLVEEKSDAIVLKLPEGEEQTIPLSDIAERTPPMSAMPPMAALLKKDEIRDLVAFLKQLNGNKKSAVGHE